MTTRTHSKWKWLGWIESTLRWNFTLMSHSNELIQLDLYLAVKSRLNRMVSLAHKSSDFISVTVQQDDDEKTKPQKHKHTQTHPFASHKQQKCSFRPTISLFISCRFVLLMSVHVYLSIFTAQSVYMWMLSIINSWYFLLCMDLNTLSIRDWNCITLGWATSIVTLWYKSRNMRLRSGDR